MGQTFEEMRRESRAAKRDKKKQMATEEAEKQRRTATSKLKPRRPSRSVIKHTLKQEPDGAAVAKARLPRKPAPADPHHEQPSSHEPSLSSTHFQDLAARLAAGHASSDTAAERKRRPLDEPEVHPFEQQARRVHDKKKAKQGARSNQPDSKRH